MIRVAAKALVHKPVVVAPKLAASEDSELRAIFRMFDKSGNGTISVSELQENMASMGGSRNDDGGGWFNPGEAQQWFSEQDIDGDGELDVDEFLSLMTPIFASCVWHFLAQLQSARTTTKSEATPSLTPTQPKQSSSSIFFSSTPIVVKVSARSA